MMNQLSFTQSRARELIIGHRGASGDAPENTFPAFELALAQGADGIEFDVRLSRDGIAVVIHDARLERTTDGAGPVRERTAAELARLDAGSWFNRRFPTRARPEFAGAGIPRLDEVLGWIRARRCRAFLEIKQSRPRARGFEEKVLEQIYAAEVKGLTTVISFHLPSLARLRRLDAHLSLGLDVMRPIVALARARKVSAQILLPHWRYATAPWIARARAAGMSVIVWGLDDPLEFQRGVPEGADGFISNYPARLRQVAETLRKQ